MARKKKTTEQLIEDLDIMVQRGFSETKQDIKKLENNLQRLEEKVDRLEFRMTGWGQRIEILEDKVRMLSVKAGLK